MLSSDQLQSAVSHGLRIDADPADAVFFQYSELFGRYAVRATRLYRKLLKRFQVKILTDHPDQSLRLRGLERRRCTAAYIQRIQDLPLHERSGCLHLSLERIEILVDAGSPGCEGKGSERAVQTSRGAKRYAHIETEPVFIVDPGQDLPFPVRDLRRKGCLLTAHKMLLLHKSGRFLTGIAGSESCHSDLCRADPDQFAPGKSQAGNGRQHVIQHMLGCGLAQRALGCERDAFRCLSSATDDLLRRRSAAPPDLHLHIFGMKLCTQKSRFRIFPKIRLAYKYLHRLLRIERLQERMDFISI